MAKSRKPNSARKPPVPSDSHAEIEDSIQCVMPACIPSSSAGRVDPRDVVFFGGADFDPPPPLGSTGRDRYVKVKTPQEAQDRRCTSGSRRRAACRVGTDRSTARS